MPILEALIQKFATEKCGSFVQYGASAAVGKDTAGYKALLYSRLFERRFVYFGSGWNGETSQNAIRVGYTEGNSRESDRQPASASKDEDMNPVEREI